MEIIIGLPKYSSETNTYQGLQGYLKQLELAVHHAQKSVESAYKNGIEASAASYVCFEHPLIKGAEKIAEETLDDLAIDYYEELQDIELKISL